MKTQLKGKSPRRAFPLVTPSEIWQRGGVLIKARILLVGDAVATGRVLKYLSVLAYQVTVVLDESAALAMVAMQPWDVVVLYMSPPLQNCLQIVQSLRSEAFCTAPLLVLAQQAEANERIRAYALGADGFLQEPFALAEVGARIDALFRRLTGSVVRRAAE
jgi:DNA-binding response OmpR family regulator